MLNQIVVLLLIGCAWGLGVYSQHMLTGYSDQNCLTPWFRSRLGLANRTACLRLDIPNLPYQELYMVQTLDMQHHEILWCSQLGFCNGSCPYAFYSRGAQDECVQLWREEHFVLSYKELPLTY